MFDRVLIVCTGNICRSPMAAGLLEDAARVNNKKGLKVDSAGLAALIDRPADPIAITLMAERGIDIRNHRAVQADAALLRGYPLILTMERRQQQFVENSWPALHGRVFRWGEWQDFDVPDPYGQDEAAFREALRMIDQGLDTWKQKLGVDGT